MKKNYALIDIFKFIFAIVVIFIHTCSGRYHNELIMILIDMAVPFFFVASGFFLNKKLKKIESKKRTVTNYLMKIFKMYVIISGVMLLMELPEIIYSENVFLEIFKKIRVFLLIGDSHLWYLLFTIYAVIILYCANKAKISNRVMFVISLIMYIMGYWILNYEHNFKILEMLKNIYSLILGKKNALPTALLFISMGINIEEYNIIQKKTLSMIIKVAIILILTIISNNLPYEILKKILLIYLVSNVFILLLKINIKSNLIFVKMRQYSTTMYLIHMPVILILCKIMETEISNDNNIVYFIFVTVISLLISMVIDYINLKHNKYKKGVMNEK